LFESMTEGFLLVEPILDEQGVPVSYRYLDANPALEHLTRLKRGDIIGRDVRDVLPGVEPYWIETFGRVALTGEPAHIEEYSRDLGGWYNVHVYSPRPGTAALIYTNITERKEAEEALQSALERQAFGQRAARSGFWDWDMQTETLDWSPEFYALFGLPPTAPASFETFQSVVHSDDRAAAMATIARSIEQHRPLENEYRIALSDGTERWIASYGDTTYDPDGRPVRMAGICVDVTERKWAEEGVRESEDRLARAQAIAHLGSWDWDVGSDRLVWSDEAYRIFGLQPEEIPAPRNEDFLAFVHPDDRARVAAAVQDALIDGQYDIEFRFVRKGGDVGYAHSQGAVSFANGAPVRMAGIVQDITEQKRAAEALQESEQRLRLATEAAKIGAFEWNIRTGVNIWTPELEAMYGLMPGEFGRTQPAWEHLVHPDDRAAAVATVDRALETGLTEEGEWRVVWRDGSVHWIIGRFQASRDADGTPLRLIGVNIDITGRKRAEEALRESEERFRVAQELSPDGFLIFRPLRDDTDVVTDFLWIYENDAAARMNDTNPGDVCGRRVSEILPHHDQSPFGKAYKDVAETGEVRVVEDASYDQDTFRQRRWFRAAAVPTTGGDVAVLVQDVTERRMAEAALHEAEERYRFALDAARFGTFDFRVDTGVVVWDERLKAIWGLAVDEDLDFAGVLGRVHPDDRERVQRLFAAALAPDSDGTYEADYRIILPDGSVRWTSARGRVHFRDVDGTRTAVRVVGIEHDITEQKEAEEALREYAENLARSNEDLERFAYVSSHDLQEPLRSIVSFSQLLERRYRGQLGQDADEYIDFIVEGGTRMQTLIQDLLAYSRVNTTRQQIARTDAEDVFAEAVRSLDVSLLEAEATLTHDPLPVVMADPIQLAQVLSNLISNAVKFRKPDVPLRVHVGARRLDGFWEFWVSDNGIGIEPEYFDRIFVIFQRLHTKETYPGTGIGLAIVKRIIDRHGGTVRVESTPGEGSTFFFTLPAA
ncbi:MAG: PAS domain-containing protein, partial [Methanospirillum sp.]